MPDTLRQHRPSIQLGTSKDTPKSIKHVSIAEMHGTGAWQDGYGGTVLEHDKLAGSRTSQVGASTGSPRRRSARRRLVVTGLLGRS